MRNRKRPRTNPWGTPYVTSNKEGFISVILAHHWTLLFK